ncbi:protein D3-like [Haemaphysalis longicornis]
MARLAMTLFQLACILLLAKWSGGSRAEDSKALKQPLVEQALKAEELKTQALYAKCQSDIWTQVGLFADLQLADIPKVELEVQYASGKVIINTSLTPAQAAQGPTVKIPVEPPCDPPYTLIMVDPDAPSRATHENRTWLHWLVINSYDRDALQNGQVATPYLKPGPPQGMGPHRYTFLTYCQSPCRILKAKEVAPKKRPNFDLRDFATTFLRGSPFAGMFFYAEYTEAVRKKK